MRQYTVCDDDEVFDVMGDDDDERECAKYIDFVNLVGRILQLSHNAEEGGEGRTRKEEVLTMLTGKPLLVQSRG